MSSQESSEEEVIFEEEEVLWAKIRGYPWWPAFVDIVHEPIEDQEAQYTVFFFGDNTHSRLGASKLRKFIQNYAECYQKAKTQRKLMMSILKAEEKLKQNGQNVEIFENIRNQLKSKRGRGAHKTDSKMSSEDNAHNMLSDLPDLKKSKTHGHQRNKSEQKLDSIQESSKKAKRLRSDTKKPEHENSQQKSLNQEQKQRSMFSRPRFTRNNVKKQDIYEQKSNSSEDKVKHEQKSPIRKNRRITIQKNKDISSQSEREDISDEKQSQIHVKPIKKQIPKKKPNPDVRGVGVVRKRGRPKKIIVEEPEQCPSQNSQKRPTNIKSFKKKPIQKQRISYQDEINENKLKKKQNHQKFFEKNEKYTKKLTQNDAQIIQRVKFCLTNRDQLIEYLSTIQITTDNVKEILDLDVTTILQEEGECTQDVIDLLQLLKATLLYKYFPDDIQIRKKYQKIIKKRQSSLKNNNEQSEEEMQYNGQQLLIRRKTSLKLQKFLKEDPNVGQKAKEIAVKIESYFRKADQSIGRKYKSLAYKVLRNLKDKTQRFKDVLIKLDNNEYDNELE